MGRIQSIVDTVTAAEADLESALLQCRVVARQLKYAPLGAWAHRELDGYSEGDALPDYRMFKSIPRGHFTNGSWSVPNKAVDPNIVGQALYDQMRTFPITSGIKSLMSQRNVDNLSILLNQYEGGVNSLYAAQVVGGYGFISLHLPVPPGAFDSVIGAVRNKLLSLLLDMSEILPEDEGLTSPTVEQRNDIEESFNQHIYNIQSSGDVVIGHGSNIHKTTISVDFNITPGNMDELSQFLLNNGVDEEDISSIEPLLGYVYDGNLTPEQQTHLATWIQETGSKMSTGVKSVSKEVAISLIANALISYAPLAVNIISGLLV